MSANTNQPIIIKRKKVVKGGGHHGGAWKVAYADFVTAMMAFFLLMWLLSSASEEQKLGIADYFSPTIPFANTAPGGKGALNGESLQSKDMAAQTGTGGIADMEGGLTAAAEMQTLRDLESALMGMGGESFLTENAMRHVITKLTDEGLVIEIFDLPGAPLFRDDTDMPAAVTQDIAGMLARVLRVVTNGVAMTGHVASSGNDAMAWDLSTSRAGRMRLLLGQGGLDTGRVARVTGKADRDQAVRDVTSERNNRLEIIVLRSDRQTR